VGVSDDGGHRDEGEVRAWGGAKADGARCASVRTLATPFKKKIHMQSCFAKHFTKTTLALPVKMLIELKKKTDSSMKLSCAKRQQIACFHINDLRLTDLFNDRAIDSNQPKIKLYTLPRHSKLVCRMVNGVLGDLIF
jgi:hypothetical protein